MFKPRLLSIVCIVLFAFLFFNRTGTAEINSPSPEMPAVDGFISAALESSVSVDVKSTIRSINLDVSVEGLEQSQSANGLIWRIDNEGIVGNTGQPDLPAINRWVMVPEHGRIRIAFDVQEQIHTKDSAPALYQDASNTTFRAEDDAPELASDAATGLFPSSPVTMSQPMIMRGVRMVMVTFYPVQYDRASGDYVHNMSFSAEIEALDEVGVNEVPDQKRVPSQGFDRMLDALLVNPPLRDDPPGVYLPGRYLVIADENAPGAVEEFIEWKRREGHIVDLLAINADEIDPAPLLGEIMDQYDETGFEYLVLMGTDDAEPNSPLYMPMNDGLYDIYYACLEGDDILPDVAVGTFNCTDEDNFTCAIRRAISYQSTPYNENNEWFTRAGVGVGACSVPQDLSPSYTGKWITEVLNRSPFEDISTSFFADNGVDDPSRMIEELYNANTNFIIVRAHEWDIDVDVINPGPVYPFHFLVSSGTISPPNTGAFNWAFRQGTARDMKGPSAGFGHYSSPRTNDANAMVGGLIEALFLLDIKTYGWARNYSLINLIRVMVADGEQRMRYEASHWRYYGDPSQWCWMGVPKSIVAAFPETIDPDATNFSLRVVSADEGEPVANALVSLNQSDEFQMVSTTNSLGDAFFTWERGAVDNGAINITVSGRNLYPLLTEIEVGEDVPFVALNSFTYDDSESGDDDGVPNPGETAVLNIEYINTRGMLSPGLASVSIECLSPWAQISGGPANLPPLEPEQFFQIEGAFQIRILETCPDQEVIRLRVTGDAGEPFPLIMAGFSITAEAPKFVFSQAEGALEPGGDADLRISIRNRGHKDSDRLDGWLESLSPFVSVISAAGGTYAEIGMNDEMDQGGNAFTVRVNANTVPGSIGAFKLILQNSTSWHTVLFTLPVGNSVITDPFGPDHYGYIAIDDTDDDVEWADAPEFSWVEINPAADFDFEGQALPIMAVEEADSSVLLQLPFPFIYYGEEFDTITVCSNGWMAVGNQTTLKNQQNWILPGFDGAFGMMAVFWDRLYYGQAGDGLFGFSDVDEGRYIIQWNAGVYDNQDRGNNTFQAILFDPERYPTPTGDSQFLFQYNEVNNIQDVWESNAHCSVGISSPAGTDGLTYTYWNEYPRACAPLAMGRAILWTTTRFDPPARIFGQIDRWIDSTAVTGTMLQTSNGFQTRVHPDGSFDFPGLLPGIFNLTASARGYAPVIIENIELASGEEVEQNILLPHAWIEVSPDSLYIEDASSGNMTSAVLLISNVGNVDLVIPEVEVLSPDTLLWPGQDDINVLLDEFPEGVHPDEDAELLIQVNVPEDVEEGKYLFDLDISTNSPVANVIIPVYVEVAVGIKDNPGPYPQEYALHSAYPNPFNSMTTVHYDLPEAIQLNLDVFDVNGRLVRMLVSERQAAGRYSVSFNSDGLSTGIYLLRMKAGHFSSCNRILLVK